MIGIDTNVLVRFLTRDDEDQFRRAKLFIDELTSAEPGFISLVTFAELVWVLERSFRTTKPVIIEIAETLIRLPGFVLEEAETVKRALSVFAGSRADFADCLIACSAARAGCAYTVTFDEQAAQGAGMRLVP